MKWKFYFLTIILMPFVVLSGCSGEENDTKAQNPGGGTDSSPAGPGSCERDYELVEQDAIQNTEQSLMYFIAQDSKQPPFNKIVLKSFQGGANEGPTGPGAIDLAGNKYNTCSFCATAYLNCTSESNCETTLFADEGMVDITELSDLSLPFKAQLKSVVFKEIEIDSFTQSATFVENGASWCAEDYTFEAKLNRYDPSATPETGDGDGIVPGVAYDECVPTGSGKGIGHNIADFTLQNCNGDDVALHSRCGNNKAIWLIASAGW